ncbi:MAG TPA: endonuclease/exonuclease/phosphatase family protein [Candidatus Sulfotelmatobacter sp.]|jgi:endonuclease/exonuclease/phosphatase family metal-dependent hydrolase
MRRTSNLVVVCLAIVILFVVQSSATEPAVQGNKDRIVRVMTRNLDAGSDFGYVLQAVSNPNTTQLGLLLAISNTFQEMIDSNIPARAAEVANEIRTNQPELIGLQEVTTLRTGPYGLPADNIAVDGLKSLLEALQQQGLHYKAIAVQTNASIDLPALDASGNLITVGFTDYDAVLARTDLQVAEFQVSNISMQHFSVILPFQVGTQSIPFLRGWISLQVKERGKNYKFVTTHLETFSPDIQAAQTNELISGPLASDLPVILAGDLNSDANQPSWQNGPAFQILEAAQFQDVWSQVHPLDPGLTWPLFAEDPPAAATPRQRIDLILTHGNGIKNRTILETGLAPANGTWGSDHAGVFGSFVLLP